MYTCGKNLPFSHSCTKVHQCSNISNGVVSLEQGMNEKESCVEFPDDWQNKTILVIFSENCQRKFEIED